MPATKQPGRLSPLPAGGTTGQVLRKSSATDFAIEWATFRRVVDAGNVSGAYNIDLGLADETEVYLTLTGNVTLTISNNAQAKSLYIVATQGGAGSFTITFPTSTPNVVVPSTQAISWNTAVGGVNRFFLKGRSATIMDLNSTKV